MGFDEEVETAEREAFLRTARHEFGHYVVARVLGFEAGGVSVSAGRKLLPSREAGDIELYLLRPLRTLDDVIQYSRDRTIVAFAGVAAADLVNGVVDQDQAAVQLTNGSGRDDYTKAMEHIHLIRNILYPDEASDAKAQIQSLFNELSYEAVKLVEEEHGLIEELAEQLRTKGALPYGAATFTREELVNNSLIIKRFKT